MDFVYLIQEREFIRLNEDTYKIGKTSQPLEKWIQTIPYNSRVISLCGVSNCHKVLDILCEVFDHLFERRPEYGEYYYSGTVDNMKKEFLLGIVSDLYGQETEIVDIEEEHSGDNKYELHPHDKEKMLRKVGATSVLRFKVN